ncbi:MAG TPA: HAD-IC family P-type ATPase, partial [Candidatus Micrarchaeota archaeon]|nr:HAD-IC family P-type ATPase [Candidatus Micrarchaeota archaeon]
MAKIHSFGKIPSKGKEMAGIAAGKADYFALDGKDVFSRLSTPKQGITAAEAQKRLAKYGLNQLAEAKKTPLYVQFISQFNNPMLMLLGLAAIISAYFSLTSAGWPSGIIDIISALKDSIGISVAILISAGFGFVQEYKAAQDIDALKKLTSPSARVLRAGQEKVIFAKEIVPGDIVLLDEGAKIPCDCRIIESVELSCDESSLTGESIPAKKYIGALPAITPLAERKNMAYYGTSVASGRGVAVATATGMGTEFGKIALSLAQTEEEDTPLQKRMEELGKKIGIYSFAIVIIYFLIGIVNGMPADLMFVSAVTLAVVSIPEGLPTILTITLAIGMQSLARQNA